MDTYIVRVYRRYETSEGMAGTIEVPISGEVRSFGNINELLDLLLRPGGEQPTKSQKKGTDELR